MTLFYCIVLIIFFDNLRNMPLQAPGGSCAVLITDFLEYIGDVPEDDNEDYYSDYGRETAAIVSEIKSVLKEIKN